MNIALLAALGVAAALAGFGQVLLKMGLNGRHDLASLVNIHVGSGLAMYAIGTSLWLFSLTRLPLSVVFPFTILTLGIVFVSSIVILGERPGVMTIAGWAVVVIGLTIVAFGTRGAV